MYRSSIFSGRRFDRREFSPKFSCCFNPLRANLMLTRFSLSTISNFRKLFVGFGHAGFSERTYSGTCNLSDLRASRLDSDSFTVLLSWRLFWLFLARFGSVLCYRLNGRLSASYWAVVLVLFELFWFIELFACFHRLFRTPPNRIHLSLHIQQLSRSSSPDSAVSSACSSSETWWPANQEASPSLPCHRRKRPTRYVFVVSWVKSRLDSDHLEPSPSWTDYHL